MSFSCFFIFVVLLFILFSPFPLSSFFSSFLLLFLFFFFFFSFFFFFGRDSKQCEIVNHNEGLAADSLMVHVMHANLYAVKLVAFLFE